MTDSQEHTHTAGERKARLVMNLSADSGYQSTVEARVSAAQWHTINAVTDGDGHVEAAAGDLLEAAEYALERFGMWTAQTTAQEDALEKLKQAIAKARPNQKATTDEE